MATNDRLASLKVKIPGGTLTLISAYAPHSGYEFDSRQRFFQELSATIRPATHHSASIIMGDFNAKLGMVMPGEEAVIGPHVFESPLATGDPALSNRALLMECCLACGLVVANTHFQLSNEYKVSYSSLTAKPTDPVSNADFAQIDHILCQQAAWHLVEACFASRLDAFCY